MLPPALAAANAKSGSLNVETTCQELKELLFATADAVCDRYRSGSIVVKKNAKNKGTRERTMCKGFTKLFLSGSNGEIRSAAACDQL
jgi:hypothetical protein